MEVCLSLFQHHRFVNRGFLLGPICPIYGCGCLLLTLLLSKYQNDTIALFALTILLCSILEYATSWIMEKIFKLRWWDYTNMKFNINGRICLETMLPFAVIGVLVIKYCNPFIIGIINKLPNIVIIILTIMFMSMLVIDMMISCNVIFNLKRATTNIRKDSTEEIKKAIHNALHNNLFMYDRIVKAFPKMTKIIKEQREKTKKFIKKQQDKKTRKNKKSN